LFSVLLLFIAVKFFMMCTPILLRFTCVWVDSYLESSPRCFILLAALALAHLASFAIFTPFILWNSFSRERTRIEFKVGLLRYIREHG
ncbi:hypothetical protein KAR91_61015, partial [Candidatus Pacearchaeota archaeon]|nr:hypothetical protein [Candidatus Pacearchaeota archaeon]